MPIFLLALSPLWQAQPVCFMKPTEEKKRLHPPLHYRVIWFLVVAELGHQPLNMCHFVVSSWRSYCALWRGQLNKDCAQAPCAMTAQNTWGRRELL